MVIQQNQISRNLTISHTDNTGSTSLSMHPRQTNELPLWRFYWNSVL
jgi:hypothetical protein